MKTSWLAEKKKCFDSLILHLVIINILGMSDAWRGIYMKINERTALIKKLQATKVKIDSFRQWLFCFVQH